LDCAAVFGGCRHDNIPVVALVSAHADRDDILRWLSGFKKAPRQTYIVHGEPRQSQALADTLHSRPGWNAQVARDGETVELV
jgi:metallo-beta-lactamase family protein